MKKVGVGVGMSSEGGERSEVSSSANRTKEESFSRHF